MFFTKDRELWARVGDKQRLNTPVVLMIDILSYEAITNLLYMLHVVLLSMVIFRAG